MALLRHSGSGRYISLGAKTVVGRGADCDFTLTHQRASTLHARLMYRSANQCWLIRDLGSLNGTLVDGQGLASRKDVALAGMAVRFGCNEEVWEVVDLSPPGPAAFGSDGTVVLAMDGVLVLPSEEVQAATIQVVGNRWTIEPSPAGQPPVQSGQSVTVGGEEWTVLLPVQVADKPGTTIPAPPSVDSHLHIRVVYLSGGVASVGLTVTVGGDVMVIEPCAHLGLLHQLALARDEAGSDGETWKLANNLVTDLGLKRRQQLNVYKHRVVGLLRDCGYPHAESIIEQREPQSEHRALRMADVSHDLSET